MANDFKITISAVDKATATVRKINESMAKMTRPVTDFQKSMNALKDEIGMNTVVKGLKEVGSAAKGVAESVGKVAAPVAALLGVGTIAGIADLAIGWGKLGMNIANTAGVIGIGTGALQSLRGAASLAGLSTGDLDGSLQSISNTLEGAQFGRNQDALLMMNRLGISVHRLANGSVDAERGLVDISRAIQGKNANVQGLIAGSFGVGALLPLLQKGPVAIAEYQAKIKQMGGIMGPEQIQSAADFQMQMQGMDISINNLKNSIGNALIPVLGPMVSKFSQWVDANKELIATKVSEWAIKISDWLKTFSLDEAIRGVKELSIAFAVLVGASFLSSLATFATLLSCIAASMGVIGGAAAVVGGIVALTPFNKDTGEDEDLKRRQRGGAAPGGTASGLVTYPGSPTKSVAPTLGIRSNNPLNLMPGGVESVYKTPEDGIAAAVANLKKNYRDLTLAGIVNKWSPPGAPGNSAAKNAAYVATLMAETGLQANQAPNLVNPMSVAALVRGQIRSENGQQPYSNSTINNGVQMGMIGGGAAAINVNLNIAGAPHGTTSQVTSSDGVAHVQTRIAYAMPTGAMP